jgi:hypothetical protein
MQTGGHELPIPFLTLNRQLGSGETVARAASYAS